MVNVDIEEELYEDIKKTVKQNKYDYASIKFFVQKAIYNELTASKNNSLDNELFYSKVRELLDSNPELKSKIDELHDSEVKKLKKGVLRWLKE